MGIPSMAISLATFINPDFHYSAKVGAYLTKVLYKNRLPNGTFLNVNVPPKTRHQIKGIKITRQGKIPIHGSFQKRIDPNLRDYYWMTSNPPVNKNDLNIDTYALNQNYVTVTPIHCDLTDHYAIKQMSHWAL